MFERPWVGQGCDWLCSLRQRGHVETPKPTRHPVRVGIMRARPSADFFPNLLEKRPEFLSTSVGKTQLHT
jgi:hypothetical protein